MCVPRPHQSISHVGIVCSRGGWRSWQLGLVVDLVARWYGTEALHARPRASMLFRLARTWWWQSMLTRSMRRSVLSMLW